MFARGQMESGGVGRDLPRGRALRSQWICDAFGDAKGTLRGAPRAAFVPPRVGTAADKRLLRALRGGLRRGGRRGRLERHLLLFNELHVLFVLDCPAGQWQILSEHGLGVPRLSVPRWTDLAALRALDL